MTYGIGPAVLDISVNYQQPTTGFSITLNQEDWHVILDPAGALASGTIIMPATPWDGQIINIRSSQIITTLTINPNSGQTVLGAPNSFAQGGGTEAVYKASDTTWYFTPGNITGQQLVAGSNLSFFVATTGSDSNPGTVSLPFLTIQHAINVAAQYDYQGMFFPTINIANGTYTITQQILCRPLNGVASPGLIKGNHASPSSVTVISSTGFDVIFNGSGTTATWNFDGLTLDTDFVVFQTQSGALFRLKGPINIGDTHLVSGPTLLKALEGVGLISSGQTLTFNIATISQYCNLFLFSIFEFVFGTIVLQVNTSWSIGEQPDEHSTFLFSGTTVTNAGSATGGGAALGTYTDFTTTHGVIGDIGQTGAVTGPPTSSINGSTSGGSGFFFVTRSGAPISTQIPAGTNEVFKDSGGAAGAGLDIFVNDASTVVGLRGGMPFQITAPASGNTVTSSYALKSNIINPAGTLAVLTVNLPTGQFNGFTTRISTSQTLTALTIATTDGSSIIGAPSTLAASGAIQFLYQSSNTTWYIN